MYLQVRSVCSRLAAKTNCLCCQIPAEESGMQLYALMRVRGTDGPLTLKLLSLIKKQDWLLGDHCPAVENMLSVESVNACTAHGQILG